jgi:hypothetical protein
LDDGLLGDTAVREVVFGVLFRDPDDIVDAVVGQLARSDQVVDLARRDGEHFGGLANREQGGRGAIVAPTAASGIRCHDCATIFLFLYWGIRDQQDAGKTICRTVATGGRSHLGLAHRQSDR